LPTVFSVPFATALPVHFATVLSVLLLATVLYFFHLANVLSPCFGHSIVSFIRPLYCLSFDKRPLCCLSFIWPMYCRFLLTTLLSPSFDHYIVCPSINGLCLPFLSSSIFVIKF
jgi:hypothetical protein